MDQVEKLSRLRRSKRNKRKLSLPALLNQFHSQWDVDSQTSVRSRKLEAIVGSPVHQLQSKKAHSTPSSTEKIGRSNSWSSTGAGEMEVLEKYKKCPRRRLDTMNNFIEDSPSTEIFKKCTKRLEMPDIDVFSPCNVDGSVGVHIGDKTQHKLGKLSSTLLSPIPVCDSWLNYTTPPRLNYRSPSNIDHKEVGSCEVDDREDEAGFIDDDNHEISNQNSCQIQTNWDAFPFQAKKKEKNMLKRKKVIRKSSPKVPSIDQNYSNKNEDNFQHKKKHKNQEFTENHYEAEIQPTISKEIDDTKGLMTIMEFLSDPLNHPQDPNKGTYNRLALPMETHFPQSSGDGCRTPVDPLNDISQLDGSAIKIRGLDTEYFQNLGRGKSTKSPMLTPKRKGVQKRFPCVNSLDNEKIDRSELGSFSKEGPFRGIRESKKNKRWSSIFPTSDEDVKMVLLSLKLDFYSRNGLIKLHPSSINHKKYQVPEEVLEGSWECLVDSPDLLSKQRRQQQSAIWELVTTEFTYLNTLKVIVEIFLSCLVNLQTDLVLVEIDTQMLFSNIQDIYAANLVLWHEHIVKMIEFSRSTGQPLDPTFLFDAFCKIDEILHPYTQYCLEQSTCLAYCRDKDFESIYFKTYLAWCETQRECNRLRLADILVTPMQRLTKYSLLLQAIMKKTTEDDYKGLLEEMICYVNKFVSKVNNTLQHHHDQKMIWDISTRIEAYEVVGSKEEELEKGVKNYSQLNLHQPMPGCSHHHQRSILFHGDMKIRDAQTSKLDVHVFLFTDMLLITKCIQKKAEKLKIIRPPFHVSRLVVIDVKDVTSVGLIYINEWNLAEASFTLQCHNEQLQKAWIQTLQQAQEHYKILQESKDDMDDSYVSDLPMYTKNLEASNFIQSLAIDLTNLETSPNIDSICTSGISSVIPSKDSGASPNVYSTNTSGVSSLMTSNYGTTDLSQIITINPSDKFASLHSDSDELCKEYSLRVTEEVNQINKNRKEEDSEFISSIWIGYSSMPGSPAQIHSNLEDHEDSGFVSGNAFRIPVKYGTNCSFLSPNPQKYSHSSERRFSSMKNISSTPINNYINAEEIVLPRVELKDKEIINIQENISENPLNEHKFSTRINIIFNESQTTDPEYHCESKLGYGYDKASISSTPVLHLQNKDHFLTSNESPNVSSALSQQRLLEIHSDCTTEGCLKNVINISPMKCGHSKIASNISTTYIYQDTAMSDITVGGFSHYVTEGNKHCMESTKSFQDELRFTIKIVGTEMDPEVSSTNELK